MLYIQNLNMFSDPDILISPDIQLQFLLQAPQYNFKTNKFFKEIDSIDSLRPHITSFPVL